VRCRLQPNAAAPAPLSCSRSHRCRAFKSRIASVAVHRGRNGTKTTTTVAAVVLWKRHVSYNLQRPLLTVPVSVTMGFLVKRGRKDGRFGSEEAFSIWTLVVACRFDRPVSSVASLSVVLCSFGCCCFQIQTMND